MNLDPVDAAGHAHARRWAHGRAASRRASAARAGRRRASADRPASDCSPASRPAACVRTRMRGRRRRDPRPAAAPARIARLERRIERFVRRRGRHALAAPRAIEDQRRAAGQQPRRARDQPERRLPRADVRHVDAQHRIGGVDRPSGRRGVQRERRQHVAEPRAPARDRAGRTRVRIGRLPDMAREALREEGTMLRAAPRRSARGCATWPAHACAARDRHRASRARNLAWRPRIKICCLAWSIHTERPCRTPP